MIDCMQNSTSVLMIHALWNPSKNNLKKNNVTIVCATHRKGILSNYNLTKCANIQGIMIELNGKGWAQALKGQNRKHHSLEYMSNGINLHILKTRSGDC